ncbi:hypothetical protein AB832_07300 [Flavobacteriaceae bacterium (ex Bugula neritina AB1)]|nr:hypothetical protein AB832_07300 [Flavobacteriaceae bacterium (ex Bugula neritina AB1)]
MQRPFYLKFTTLVINFDYLTLFSKVALVLSSSASMYLTALFFWSMSNNVITAIVFLCVGISSEIGKYTSWLTAYRRKWVKSFLLRLTALAFVGVSVAGSVGSLLKKDTVLDQAQSYQKQIDDRRKALAVEEQITLEASRVNSQTVGVNPSRIRAEKLQQEIDQLQEKLLAIAPEPTSFNTLSVALSEETGLPVTAVEIRLALSVSLLLEFLCLFFAAIETRRVTDSVTGSDKTVTPPVTPRTVAVTKPVTPNKLVTKTSDSDNVVSLHKGKDFDDLVKAIQSGEIKNNSREVRKFMKTGSDKVPKIRKQLADMGL